MNARLSAMRLPEPLRTIIAAEPAVRSRLDAGLSWEHILCSPDWAADWAAQSESESVRLLAWLLKRYAGVPFEERKTEMDAVQEGQFTGAEIRVGLARLRCAGVLFAVRKTWGERLYYIPADMVPVWLRLLLPLPGKPLTAFETAETERYASPFRLPLSLEMFTAWADIRRYGLPLTAKGVPAKPYAARLAAAMRITTEELASIAGTCLPSDRLFPQTALALDLGLSVGVLSRKEAAIDICTSGLRSWLTRNSRQTEAELYRLVMQRYASGEGGRHLAASAVSACVPHQWYRIEDLTGFGLEHAPLRDWLDLLVSFGWAERGTWRGRGVFRVLYSFDPDDAAFRAEQAEEPFHVLPDGEIIVPPDVEPADRWTLEQIAERVSADRVFIYRLTRDAMVNAAAAGFGEREIAAFLEKGSAAPLPEPVREALKDWFSRLGKVRFEQVTLLRTDCEQTVRRLIEDPEITGKLGERLGNLDFIVDRVTLKPLVLKLEQIGYSPVSLDNSHEETAPESETPAQQAGNDEIGGGWMPRTDPLTIFQPDQTIPQLSELFPGLPDVPASWVRQPAAYHTSTRRELIRKAIGWRTALRLKDGEDRVEFVPQQLDEHGEKWEVRGHWKTPDEPRRHDERHVVTLSPDRLAEIMIVVPDWEPVS